MQKQRAKEMKFTVSTIEKHLSECVEKRWLKISTFVSDPKIVDHILSVINSEEIKCNVEKLKPIKELCDPIITYSQIRYTVAYFKSTQLDLLCNRCNRNNHTEEDCYAKTIRSDEINVAPAAECCCM